MHKEKLGKRIETELIRGGTKSFLFAALGAYCLLGLVPAVFLSVICFGASFLVYAEYGDRFRVEYF